MRAPVPVSRYLLRAKELVDANYSRPIDLDEMARAAGFSRAHFARQFRRAFGETPHAYLLTRRLERAASLLLSTDWPVTRICLAVGLTSLGSFTTSFTRTFGMSPTAYRAAHPGGEERARLAACVIRAYGRPQVRPDRAGDPADGQ